MVYLVMAGVAALAFAVLVLALARASGTDADARECDERPSDKTRSRV